MGDGYYLDIILFALVAAFLVLRLRSVLGRRGGFQGKSDQRVPFPGRGERADDQPVRLPERGDAASEVTAGEPTVMPASLEVGLTQIRVADPGFDEKEFVGGAQKAFELILQAFAQEDVRALQALLSQDVITTSRRPSAPGSRRAKSWKLPWSASRPRTSLKRT